MPGLIHYNHCPVCGASRIREVFPVKDHTVSHESFAVWQCDECTLRFTQDVPDAETIAPYYHSENYISHTNTSKGFINRLYQRVRRKTLRQKRKLVIKLTGKKTGTLLDIGSGTGAFVQEMRTQGWQVTGLEPDAGARQVAQEDFATTLDGIDSFYRLPAASFDAITMWHVLEHVHDLQGYMAQLKKLLREDGRLFIAVPNYTSKDAAFYKQYWAAYDVPRHLYHFSPASLQRLMEGHGLKLVTCKPMWYDSFYISLLSSRYKNGKTNMAGAVLTGLRSNIKAWTDVKRCSSVIYVIGK